MRAVRNMVLVTVLSTRTHSLVNCVPHSLVFFFQMNILSSVTRIVARPRANAATRLKRSCAMERWFMRRRFRYVTCCARAHQLTFNCISYSSSKDCKTSGLSCSHATPHVVDSLDTFSTVRILNCSVCNSLQFVFVLTRRCVTAYSARGYCCRILFVRCVPESPYVMPQPMCKRCCQWYPLIRMCMAGYQPC